MGKTLIVAMALSLVLVSGSFFSAQADCGLNHRGWRLNLNSCGWRLPTFINCSAFSCTGRDTERPRDATASSDLGDTDNSLSFRGK